MSNVTIPTIQELKDQFISDIESKIGQNIPILAKAFMRIFSGALGGILYLLYRFGLWIYDQIFPGLAAEAALLIHGRQFGIIRTAAVKAKLTAIATGTAEEIIPAKTKWFKDDIVYSQDSDAEIDIYGEAVISITALKSGISGNQVDGAEIEIVTAISGIDKTATISETTRSGSDIEDIDDYRERVEFRYGNQPQGGSAPDYIGWATEVSGIVKAFAFRTNPGEVTVYPLISLTENRIPDSEKLAEVLTYLDDTSLRPLCADVLVGEMTELTFDITVTSVSPNTAAMRSAINSAWTNYLLGRFPNQYSGQSVQTDYVSLSGLYREAAGAGADYINFTIYKSASPITYYQLQSDELAKIGTVTWP